MAGRPSRSVFRSQPVFPSALLNTLIHSRLSRHGTETTDKGVLQLVWSWAGVVLTVEPSKFTVLLSVQGRTYHMQWLGSSKLIPALKNVDVLLLTQQGIHNPLVFSYLFLTFWESGMVVEMLIWFYLFDIFSCGVISTLRSQEESSVDKSYCTLLDCLCSWGQVGHILELLDDWLPGQQPQAKVFFRRICLRFDECGKLCIKNYLLFQGRVLVISVCCLAE